MLDAFLIIMTGHPQAAASTGRNGDMILTLCLLSCCFLPEVRRVLHAWRKETREVRL